MVERVDNALVIDGILAAVLLAGALIGAWRGLFKSLMGAAAVLLAMVGAVFLAGILTDPITDWIVPRVEDKVVSEFSAALEKAAKPDSETAGEGQEKLVEMLNEYGLSESLIDEYLTPLTQTISGVLSDAGNSLREKAADSFRGTVSGAIRALVSGTVHTVLVFVSYVVLLIALRLAINVVDHVFDLPVLHAANTAGGAALGLLEALLLLYVLVYLAVAIGFSPLTDHADDTVLLSLMLRYSPVSLLTQLLGGSNGQTLPQ